MTLDITYLRLKNVSFYVTAWQFEICHKFIVSQALLKRFLLVSLN